MVLWLDTSSSTYRAVDIKSLDTLVQMPGSRDVKNHFAPQPVPQCKNKSVVGVKI